jgi:hypothetical protein
VKAYLAQLLQGVDDPVTGRNLVREYLQARILESLQRAGAMIPLAFHGGTALRFLYAIPRFSEDLDFMLETPGAGYDFRAYLRHIQDVFSKEGYRVGIKLNDQKPVNAAMIRFDNLLYELGLSPHWDEVLAVKIEVDTNPPAGAGLNITLIRRHVTLRLQHHDRASLLAGKLHALFQRRFEKGRDLYDLMWYLSDPDWPEPNITLLQNALQQTGWDKPGLNEKNWRGFLCRKLAAINWTQTVGDVMPFLERSFEVELLTEANLSALLGCASRSEHH